MRRNNGDNILVPFLLKLTLCILMDFPIQINTITIGLSIIHFKGFPDNYELQSLKIVFILANSAAFHLGLHCLLKYPFRGFQNTKG